MPTTPPKPRGLFTDGWNSFWHVVFGILATTFPRCIVPTFLAYQLYDPTDPNVCVDLSEFMYGFLVGMVIECIHKIF